MPPVLGPRPPSRMRLKSCAGCSARAVGAVADREERHLGAVEELLDHDPLAARRVGQRLGAVGGHHDALAGGEAVVLDDVRRAQRVEGGRRLVGGGAHEGAGRRHAGRSHHVLAERLGALEPGRLAGRAVAPRCRRRGPRRRPRRPAAPRARRRRGRRPGSVASAATAAPSIGSTSCRVATSPMPGLPGAACTSASGSRAREQGQRVLAAAGADDEGLHGRPPYRRARLARVMRRPLGSASRVCVASGPRMVIGCIHAHSSVRRPDASSTACRSVDSRAAGAGRGPT